MVTVHVEALPEQAPPQDDSVEPLCADALSVTTVPLSKLDVQLLPHEIPLGFELIVPLPLFVTVSA
jgi:hypothetical protein